MNKAQYYGVMIFLVVFFVLALIWTMSTFFVLGFFGSNPFLLFLISFVQICLLEWIGIRFVRWVKGDQKKELDARYSSIFKFCAGLTLVVLVIALIVVSNIGRLGA